jgi:histidinol-phosphatase (PHP family)
MNPFTYHNHTVFCDGKNTVEEMVISAIEHGCDSIGFSAHSYTPFDSFYCMPTDKIAEYRKTVLECREKYKDKIEIYLGIERDSWSPVSEYAYDYTIASVHNIWKDGVYCQVDLSADCMMKNVELHFGGDHDAYAEAYFEEVMRLFDKIPEGDVIGHIDLITKYDEQLHLCRSPRYFALAQRAIDHLAKYGKPFEMNTGAIGRGLRTTPYPSPELLKMIKNAGGRIMINSDCHNRVYLDCAFDQCVNLAKNCGFDSHVILTRDGWKEIKFDEM